MAERIPPNNRDAERAALGAALSNVDALADVLDTVTAADFYDAAHREIFSSIYDLASKDKAVDIVSVSDDLYRKGSLEAAGGRAYIAELPLSAPVAANAKEYANIVAEKATLRKLIKTADEIKGNSFDEELDARDILDKAEQGIFDIAQGKQKTDYTPLKEVLDENVEIIDRISKSEGKLTGIPTGFQRLDEMTNGLQKSDLIILAARPAMGKSAFALNLARNAAKEADASIIIFNLEMPKTQLGLRLLSIESRVEMKKLQSGRLQKDDWQNISVAMDTLADKKIMIDETPGISVMEMKNKCRRLKKAQGLDLVIVDYLQLMEAEGRSENRQNEISKISRQFKLLARELDCPVLLLSQLSREPEKRMDHRPIPADLRDSGSIEQDADIIIFLYRDEVYAKEESAKPGICEVNIAKHRNGETGVFDLTFVERYTKFSDVSRVQ